jgi:DNA-binding NarL/FixJ family response regulator
MPPRRVQIIKLIKVGKTNKEIAQILGISINTVKTTIQHAKLVHGVSRRYQLVQFLPTEEETSGNDDTITGKEDTTKESKAIH